MELDILDPWFLPENIPGELHELANVILMPTSYFGTGDQHDSAQPHPRKIRSFFRHLPLAVQAPLRQFWYALRGEALPGHHAPDAVATNAETAFVADRTACCQPDVLIANETFLGNLLTLRSAKTQMLTVSIAFDLQHQRQQSFQHSKDSPSQDSWNHQKEAELLGAADVIVAIHEDDATTLRIMVPHADVICVPMAANVHLHPKVQQISGRCLFVGSDIAHNVQGLQWFLREVWPLVQRVLPASTLHVCGSVDTKMTGNHPNVKLSGRVDDIEQEYAEAELCVIPLIAGSGLKIKLVEALSHGRACVSTSIGVQGLQELDGKAILVAETSQDFANAVLSVLQDAAKRQALEQEARRYVTDFLSPEKTYQPFVGRIKQYLVHSQKRKDTL